jgi:protein-S-isoprenylcysteine O-methyltransferase Ste14
MLKSADAMESVKTRKEFLRFIGTRAITLILTLAAAYLFDLVLKTYMSISPTFGAVGIALILITKLSDYRCIRALLSGGGTFYGRPPTSLVVDGPYHYVRNPLYISAYLETHLGSSSSLAPLDLRLLSCCR